MLEEDSIGGFVEDDESLPLSSRWSPLLFTIMGIGECNLGVSGIEEEGEVDDVLVVCRSRKRLFGLID